ncbi:MAG TPA: DUF397 domain-containing protein [Actinoplanes sp.]
MPDLDDTPDPEVLSAARFRKSRRSDNSGSCVEVAVNLAAGRGLVLVRDTKDRAAGVLALTPAQWSAFTSAVCAGRFSDFP